ncbi:hypothetical protein [Paenibacillus terrigena]|uniref:hypothetical protein n=1 Tax=Paenibacillus terrigena TaxID=369333 RepID=UPI0028D3FCA6|nr:hypothetical protein [Paenibacillus terrigena]
MKYDSREAENRIQDERVNLSRQKLMMEGLQERYIEAAGGEQATVTLSKSFSNVALTMNGFNG